MDGCCIYPILQFGRSDKNQLVIWVTGQSLDILWSCTKSLLEPNNMPGDAFQMVKLSLLQITSPYSRHLEVCTVDCQRIHTASFHSTDTSNTTEFSRSYGPSRRATCIIAWTCCRELSCIPLYRICCLQNWKRPTKALNFFLGVKNTRCNNLSSTLERMLQNAPDCWTGKLNQCDRALHLCKVCLPPSVVYVSYQGIQSTAGPQITFRYNTDEMPKESNSCLYQLAYGKLVSLYVISLKVTKPIDINKWRLTVFTIIRNVSKLSVKDQIVHINTTYPYQKLCYSLQ